MSEKEIIVVDSQRLNMIQLCAARYDMTFNKLLVPIEKQSFFEKGDLLHKMLETYYKLKIHRLRWAQNNTTLKDVVNICKRVGEHHMIKMAIPLAEAEEVIYQFEEYVDFYGDEPHIPLAVERVGSKVLYEDEELVILYETKIDLIVEMTKIPVLPIDHKTSSRRSETVSLSNQFIGYCWMLNVHNIMINKIGFQKTLKPHERFQRPLLSYSQDIIDEWQANAVWWIKMIRYHESSKNWTRNYTSCDKWGGCIFRQICESQRDVRAWKARQLFDVRSEPWDVGKILK